MREANDFVKKLNLQNQKFSNVSMDGMLISVFDFTNTIWQKPMLYTFVEHGVDHSYAVLEKAMDIFDKLTPDEVELSPLERLILGIGTLIHDIGMQYNKYPSSKGIIDDSEVRKIHPELGFEMIKDVRDGIFECDRSGPPLSLEDHHKVFLHYGALVGFAHSGSKYWEILKQGTYDPRKEGGMQLLRSRALAALIRLADELHCEYTRVPEINWIDSSQLTPESKAHWTACYYTQEIKITAPGTAGLRITMNWRVPENISDDERNLYRTLLQDLREKKINEETELVKEYLSFKDESEPYLIEFKLAANPQSLPIKTLPKDAKKFITESLRPYQYGLKNPIQSEKILELTSSSILDDIKFQAQKFYLAGSGTQNGHFRLKTGWHTNKYLNCRELCSEPHFIHSLCQELVMVYSKYGITDVLAIGTSAIRIGSYLSFLLEARFSFTFNKVNIKNHYFGDSNYTDYELEFTTFSGGNILMVDDILAVGNVINEIVTKLNAIDPQPKSIKIFTIYRLGDIDITSMLSKKVDIRYLKWFPDVNYYQEDTTKGTCIICEASPEKLTIEE